MLEKAAKLLEEGDYRKAEQLLREILKKESKPEALFDLALCLFKQERLDESLEILRELIHIQPQHEKAKFLMATIFRRTGRLLEAKKMFEELGFEELAASIPEPVQRQPKPEIKLPKLEEFSLFEFKAVVEIQFSGKIELPEENFALCVLKTKEHNIQKKQNRITVTGEGKVYILTENHPLTDISSTQGEKLIHLAFPAQTTTIKVEKDEIAYYRVCPEIKPQSP